MKLNNNLKIDADRVKRRKMSGVFPNCIDPLNHPIPKLLYLGFFVMRDDKWQH